MARTIIKLPDLLAIAICRKKSEYSSEILLQKSEAGWWFPCRDAAGVPDETILIKDFNLPSNEALEPFQSHQYHFQKENSKNSRASVKIFTYKLKTRFDIEIAKSKWFDLYTMKRLDYHEEPLLTEDPIKVLENLSDNLRRRWMSEIPHDIISPKTWAEFSLLCNNPEEKALWTVGSKKLVVSFMAGFKEDDLSRLHLDFITYCWPAFEMTYPTFSRLFEPSCQQSVRGIWNMIATSNRISFFTYLSALALFYSPTENDLYDTKMILFARRYIDWNSEYGQFTISADQLPQLLQVFLEDPEDIGNLKLKGTALTLSQFSALVSNQFYEDFREFNFLIDDTLLPKIASVRQNRSKQVKKILRKIDYLQGEILNLGGRDLEKVMTALGQLGPNSYAESIKHRKVLLRNQIPFIGKNSNQLQIEETPMNSLSSENSRSDKPLPSAFNDGHKLAKEVLGLLRNFFLEERKSSSVRADSIHVFSFKWKNRSKHGKFLKILPLLVEKCEPIFLSEPRLLQIEGSCYVSGDIHGNFHDLSTIGHYFWRYGPYLSPAKMVFLGDYVDRGPNQLEVLGYLMAQKLLAPDRVFLIRGNHDDARINIDFRTYCSEAVMVAFEEIDTEEMSGSLWFYCNRLFSVLPVAVLINKTIFCSHSGILSGRNVTGGFVDLINDKVPSRLPSLLDNEITLELAWNDPLSLAKNKSPRYAQDLSLSNDGFLGNSRRIGSLSWASSAFQSFLVNNNLEYFIRAQGANKNGSGLMTQEPRLLTVACSEYGCKATIAMIDSGFVQLVKIDTQHPLQDLQGFSSTPTIFPTSRNSAAKPTVKFQQDSSHLPPIITPIHHNSPPLKSKKVTYQNRHVRYSKLDQKGQEHILQFPAIGRNRKPIYLV